MLKHTARDKFIALNRFGLGARIQDISNPGLQRNPRQWLLNQLKPLSLDAEKDPGTDIFAAFEAYQKARQREREARKQAKSADIDAFRKKTDELRKPLRAFYRTHNQRVLQYAMNTEYGMQARLFDFFSNHFSISANNIALRVLAPLFERQVIAPNLSGKFADLLVAAEQHPAMLVYLNNDRSIGPDSNIGRRRKRRGLNENLAREILELHTLGVDGGYTQQDVRELAMAITGWGVDLGAQRKTPTGFVFSQRSHQPGTRNLLGKTYAYQGVQQGEQILRDLAVHPATAKHVSYKLARHFIADEPDPQLLASMQQRWLATKGDLYAVLRVMIEHPASWQIRAQKYKTPREFVISTMRASKPRRMPAQKILKALNIMGQAPFSAGSPAGYGDTESAWDGPEALITRIEWANNLSRFANRDVIQIAEQALGDYLRPATRLAIQRAESRQQALILFLMSPEFQRR